MKRLHFNSTLNHKRGLMKGPDGAPVENTFASEDTDGQS